jgi:aldehyde:ferredoxin oxidoreductase
MIKGVTDKILWVDLTRGTCTEEVVPEAVYENYLSGVGLAAYYLYQRIPAGAGALGPDNILAFVSGLLTATGSLMTGRWLAAAKSPLTNTWGAANCGGMFAPAVKQCSYDGIFFAGASATPVYLYVDHSHAELRDASALWGKDAREPEELIKQGGSGREIQVACIGEAGERLSLISGIVNDQGRLAARSGLGAVMGSKKLKAVALAGSHPIPVANPAEMKRLTNRFLEFIALQPVFLNGAVVRMLGVVMLSRQIKPVEWLRPVWSYPACVKCRICVTACPTGAIDLARGRSGPEGVAPAYPFLWQPKACIGCCFCEQSCPTGAIGMKEPQRAAHSRSRLGEKRS